MSSTNKTSNYELSQYVGSDMPTYLGDYNSDMLKIDTQMKANNTLGNTADEKAEANALAIGTLANLKTTTKTNVVSALNEVKDIEGFSIYDSTHTYSVGDFCIYNNSLYKCISAITTPEAWNSSHWLATSIESETKNNNNANTYNTTETIIGAWLGKPLYRKVINLSALPSDTTPVTYDVGYNLSEITLVKLYGNAKGTNAQFSLPYFTADSGDPRLAMHLGSVGGAAKISIRATTNLSSYSGYAIIEYIKNAD